MSYTSLRDAVADLEKNGHLVRVREELAADLELAAVHERVFEAGGPALLFERVQGCRFQAVSNLFGTLDRGRFLFRHTLDHVQRLIGLRSNPLASLKQPFRMAGLIPALASALPLRNPLTQPALHQQLRIGDLPQVRHWPADGGAFVTLPQVYTEDPDQPGILHANLGMYRIQLSGNDYVPDREIGLHYQLHRGIGVHQSRYRDKGLPMKVSVFIGGPPAHTVAAVMPLPEGMSEAVFAGVLGGRRFRYTYVDGYCISTDADFVITGEVHPGENKLEGPFGDHLGYYSLQHPFPLLRVHKVFAREQALWPFTVVGRPPQEDTCFGALIHEITGDVLPKEIPGLLDLHAVDAAGVHPLLLAVGSERYTPFLEQEQPGEILTIASHILGTGQLSLAKYLFITADPKGRVNTKDIPAFFRFLLERIRPERDLHFHTHTTIDTLDYSGTALNSGSKVVLAAYGPPCRELCADLPEPLCTLSGLNAAWVMPGVAAFRTEAWQSGEHTIREVEVLNKLLLPHLDALAACPLLVWCDDPAFVAQSLRNFLWVCFTRSNPSHDIHGVASFIENKHWGCRGPLIIDARAKAHHAPAVEKDPEVEKKIDSLFAKGGSLEKWG